MSIAIGIDPGSSSGGMAALWFSKAIPQPEIFWIKLKGSTPLDIFGWLTDLPRSGHSFAFLERVHAMPGGGDRKMGATGAFRFGASFGELQMALTAAMIPFELVTPSVWQGAMGCRSKGDKNVTKLKAQELFPDPAPGKITHWNADALLMAEHARRIMASRGLVS